MRAGSGVRTGRAARASHSLWRALERGPARSFCTGIIQAVQGVGVQAGVFLQRDPAARTVSNGLPPLTRRAISRTRAAVSLLERSPSRTNATSSARSSGAAKSSGRSWKRRVFASLSCPESAVTVDTSPLRKARRAAGACCPGPRWTLRCRTRSLSMRLSTRRDLRVGSRHPRVGPLHRWYEALVVLTATDTLNAKARSTPRPTSSA